MIVLLDQEKVYDKITHKYLWKTLEAVSLSDEFISTVKSLYSNANTVVIVNGMISPAFRVTRGVRQGDPLSCLLFNLAIEPLAALLQDSNLEEYKVPGILDKLIVTLFADDTTVYLSKNDKFSDLKRILDLWCAASGAKFNVPKTIIIPIGLVEHRTQLMNEHQSREMPEVMPEGIHIAEDGESTRSLGLYIGNNLDPTIPWNTIITATEDVLNRVQKLHPLLNGKRVGIQTYMVLRLNYLAIAEDMPNSVEKRFERMEFRFFWEEKTARINKQTLKLPLDEGGQNLVDIKLRNNAIHLVHLINFLGLNGPVPRWALVVQDILRTKVLSTYKNIDPQILTNIFLQT